MIPVPASPRAGRRRGGRRRGGRGRPRRPREPGRARGPARAGGAAARLGRGVESRAAELVAAADAETALGVPRLAGELARVAYQFRFFADIVDDGEFLGVVIDPPDPSAVPPRPALRRWKVPIGTVAVFAASNFPFAFSVPGGDTASAVAAGCPVVVKAHPDHPETSELAAETMRDAAEKVGLPADVLTPGPRLPGRRSTWCGTR